MYPTEFGPQEIHSEDWIVEEVAETIVQNAKGEERKARKSMAER